MYTLKDPIRRAEQVCGDREAVVCGARRRTFAELAARVRRVAGLLDSFTARGDRVALWSLNSDLYLELFLGIPCADRVIVPHNTRWAEPELAYATLALSTDYDCWYEGHDEVSVESVIAVIKANVSAAKAVIRETCLRLGALGEVEWPAHQALAGGMAVMTPEPDP